jgi:hypothetical protein
VVPLVGKEYRLKRGGRGRVEENRAKLYICNMFNNKIETVPIRMLKIV